MFKDGSNPTDTMLDPFYIPYGYFQKAKFSSDKKSNWMDLTTKDQRQFKFRFENAEDFHKVNVSLSPFMYTSKYWNLYAFSYA